MISASLTSVSANAKFRVCPACGDFVFEDEDRVPLGQHLYHLECLDDMPIRKLLVLMDIDVIEGDEP